MDYLATQTIVFSFLSMIFGFALGWMLKNVVRKSEIRERDNYWAINMSAMKNELTKNYRPFVEQRISIFH